ncbi:MAG: translation elongation factor Ts [Bryobacteraceae bacterium]
MAEVSAALVKQLREKTGAGMMDCKKALDDAKGDLAEAEVILRKKGIAAAAKRQSRAARAGVIQSYIHAGNQIGVMLELNCETDFVARTEDFLALAKDLAMQVAAADPKYLRRDDVPADVLAKEREIAADRAKNEGKPEKVIEKIVDGRVAKFYEEVCLLDQPFIKENTTSVEQLIKGMISKMQENISIARFARFKVGETAAAAAEEAAG